MSLNYLPYDIWRKTRDEKFLEFHAKNCHLAPWDACGCSCTCGLKKIPVTTLDKITWDILIDGVENNRSCPRCNVLRRGEKDRGIYCGYHKWDEENNYCANEVPIEVCNFHNLWKHSSWAEYKTIGSMFYDPRKHCGGCVRFLKRVKEEVKDVTV